MPDWTNYVGATEYNFTYRGRDISYIPAVVFTETQIREQYEAYQREQEQNARSVEQMWVEHQQRMEKEFKQEKQLQEDKENYPLFFWKENIK